MDKMKKCTRCKEIKNGSEFYSHPNNKDKLGCYCKVCNRIKSKEWNIKQRKIVEMVDVEGEEWKDIKGYEGVYQASNLGNIRSLNRYDESGHLRNGKVLKQCTSSIEYLGVNLMKNKIRKSMLVHRIVAETFIPNPNNYKAVNHKDEDKTNNNIDNLEWCTYKYNSNYGTAIERSRKSVRIPVYQYTLEKVLVKRWISLSECRNKKGYSTTIIGYCCKGKRKSYKNYTWSYTPIEEEIKNAN